MTRSICSTLAVLALTAIPLLAPPPAWADSNKQPAITEVRADPAMVWLEIVGVNLGMKPPRVTLGRATNPLAITSATPTLVTALLPPGMAPGGYLLTYSASKNKSGSDDDEGSNYEEFWVTLGVTGMPGSAGAPGAKGDIGPQGAQGQTGPAGPQGFAGAAGAAGAMGPQGPAGPTGPQGPTGSSGSAILWARVAANGDLISGVGVGAVSHYWDSPSYIVDFSRDVSKCAVLATAAGAATVRSYHDPDHPARVYFNLSAFMPGDFDFAAFCPP